MTIPDKTTNGIVDAFDKSFEPMVSIVVRISFNLRNQMQDASTLFTSTISKHLEHMKTRPQEHLSVTNSNRIFLVMIIPPESLV